MNMASATECKASSLDEAKEKYEYFWKQESPFSQWHPSKFNDESQSYMCAEQYMMYQKAGEIFSITIVHSVLILVHQTDQYSTVVGQWCNRPAEAWEVRD